MKTLTLKQEMTKEYRNSDSWYRQIHNIIYSLSWGLVAWSIVTSTFMVYAVILIVFHLDETTHFYVEDVKNALLILLLLCGMVSFILVLIFEIPSTIKNIFREEATERIDRYNRLVEERENQIRISESLLMAYQLIDSNDIHKRRSKLKGKQLI